MARDRPCKRMKTQCLKSGEPRPAHLFAFTSLTTENLKLILPTPLKNLGEKADPLVFTLHADCVTYYYA